MANQITDNSIVLNGEYTEDDALIIKANPALPVYPENTLSDEVIQDLGRDVSSQDIVRMSRDAGEDTTVVIVNSYVDTVQVLLPINNEATINNVFDIFSVNEDLGEAA